MNSEASVIAQQLNQRNIGQLLYGENGQHAALLEDHFTPKTPSDENNIKLEKYDFLLTDHKKRLFDESPASFTSSKCSIAATGTIVLWPTPEEPRKLSLVPPVHFALVDTKNMVCDFTT